MLDFKGKAGMLKTLGTSVCNVECFVLGQDCFFFQKKPVCEKCANGKQGSVECFLKKGLEKR